MTYRIKKTIACKEIENYKIEKSLVHTHTPKYGEVGIFEVLEIGKHFNIQGATKRLETIIEGDYIMAAFANRYATEQFEGYIPEKPTEYLHILGAGGAMGIIKSTHAFLKDIGPTSVRLVGYAVDETGKILNTINYKTKRETFAGIVPNNAKVILSVGSSMDSGKTTTAAYLARGLKTSGKKVTFIKLTGTSYTKDKDLVYDCGADVSIDFVDAGYPSTYMLDKPELMDLYQTLLHKLIPENPDYIVMEIADGVVQRETEYLLRDSAFMATIHSVVFSASESLAAFWGTSFLTDLGFKPVALAGLFTASPLLIEEVEARMDIPVLTLEKLMSKQVVSLFETREVVHA